MTAKKNKKKIALVLGGGGARGLAHIGVLKVLAGEGISVDRIVGVSMGAVIGAMYALGMPVKEIEKTAQQYENKRTIAGFLDLGSIKRSIIKGNKIRKLIEGFVGDKKIEDAPTPLSILATDLGNGEEKVFDRGPLLPAIMASICVPGVFPPVSIGGRYYVDGGVVNPTPVDVAARMKGIDLVVAVDIVMRKSERLIDPNIVKTLVQSYEIMQTKTVKKHLQNGRTKAVIITPAVRSTADGFKFSALDKFIAAGEAATKKKIPEILKKLA